MTVVNRKRFIEKYSKAVNEGYAAVFAGAGLSKGSGYVDWKTLVTPFAEDLGLNIDEEYDLARIAQYYRNENRTRTEINQEIVDRFSIEQTPNENIELITRLPIYTYWTTNYDKLLEKGLENNNRRVDVKINQNQLTTHKRDRDAILYKMHGDVDSAAEAVLTKEDYEVYNRNRPLFSTVLQGDLVSKVFLFIGFSFEDPNLDNILSNTRSLLGENVGTNYWLEKKLQPPIHELHETEKEKIEIKERYDVDKTKQKLKINELQRYGIQTVFIDSYDEISDILKELETINLRKNIFISGSIEMFNDEWTKYKVENFCFMLAKKIVSNNYKIFSGFGLGVGSSIVNGALDEIYSSKYRHMDEHILLRPFPQNMKTKEEATELWTKYREDIISDVGVSIFIFGNKKDTLGANKIADGVIQEYEIAKQKGNIIIPVGSTGEATKQIFDEVKVNIERYPYLEPYLVTLEKSTDECELIDTIEAILKRL